jgi:mRNA interferase RelE/StbE
VGEYTIEWTIYGQRIWREITDKRIRQKLLELSASLADAPYQRGEPLAGDLDGFWSLHWSRWRTVYSVDEDRRVVLIHIVGMRAEGKKKDVYSRLRRLLSLQLLGPLEDEED